MPHPSITKFRLRCILASRPLPGGPKRFALPGAGMALLSAGFIGCSAVEPRGADSNLSGMGTPFTPITESALKILTSGQPSRARKFTVNYRVVDAKGQLVAESLMSSASGSGQTVSLSGRLPLRVGQKGKVEVIREFPFPTEFDPPQGAETVKPGLKGSFPILPSTPRVFGFRNCGWVISDLNVRPEAAFLMVSGTFRETTFEGFIRNAGEAFSPIVSDDGKVVLTDNKALAPTFSDRETPFIMAALPGKTYRTRLHLRHPDAFLEISCQPVETD